MNRRKIILITFGIVAFAQLYAPAKMIFDREEILDKGKSYKFLTAPIDPSDPFRGKYVSLNYDDNYIYLPKISKWMRGDIVYVTFKDSSGFAKIDSVLKEKPQGSDYLKTKVDYLMTAGKSAKMTVEYPFSRFYMEESKAPRAEQIYAENAAKKLTKLAYGLVSIKDGEAVLTDVILDGKSIREIAKEAGDN